MSDQISAEHVISVLRDEINQLHWELTLARAKALQAELDAAQQASAAAQSVSEDQD